MERNYRSTNQIVEKAQSFISRNRGRYEKNMTAERGDGEAVALEHVESREMQYARILEIAKKTSKETAFLYRDNESSVVLVDMFLRNNISFKLRKPEMNFFGNKVVKDIVAYLTLALNEYDVDSFSQICNKGILYLKNQQKEYAIKSCKYQHISVYDAVENQMKYLKENQRDRARRFKRVMDSVSKAKTLDAISILMRSGYDEYLEDNHFDSGKVDILTTLAKHEQDIQNFLNRLSELEKVIQKGFNSKNDDAIILSTIHSSKGLEYDSVYMVDVYDGRFPSSRPDIFSRSKDNANGEQEERRLFYVGITRAKNKLTLFSIKDEESTFIDELFPEEKTKRLQNIRYKHMRSLLDKSYSSPVISEEEKKERLRITEERKVYLAEMDYNRRYDQVKDKFNQQTSQIYDSSGQRWIQCEICGEIKPESEFGSYGGPGHVNLGKCYKCTRDK
jgi:DNA helicase-2/ATP-dependent DNA helicase PcrA